MTMEYMDQKQWTHFDFYTTGGANGAFKDSLALGKVFKITDVRLHLSVKHPSVEDFVIWLSSAKGSAFNQIYISQAMSDVKDYLWQPGRELIFDSEDQLIFSMFIKSGSNIYGLNVRGWSVNG